MVRDVDTGAHVVGDGTMLLQSWAAYVKNGTILSVMTAEPIRHLEGFAPVKGVRISLQAEAQMFAVNIFRPAVSQLRVNGATREPQPGLVEISTEFVRTSHPAHHGSCVCHKPEAFFALPQLLQGLLVFRDILLDRSYVNHIALSVFHGPRVDKHCSLLPFFREDEHFLVV